VTARARIARDASALPLAGGSCAVTWRDAVTGAWHTAFVDSAADAPHGMTIARNGRHAVIERKWKQQRVTETTETRMGDVA
jgi:hypothetical protein